MYNCEGKNPKLEKKIIKARNMSKECERKD